MKDESTTAKLVYILYLASLVFGITGIIGVIIAYVNKGDGSHWLDSHYRFQIRTFWIGLLYTLIGAITVFILIGYLILLCTVIWMIVRCVVGFKYINRQQAYPAPGSWLF